MNKQLIAVLERVKCFLADPVCADDSDEISLLRAEVDSHLELLTATTAGLPEQHRGRPELLRDACLELVATIHATGGLTVDDDGCDVPVADTEWPDLGAAYLLACEALGYEPSYRPGSEPAEVAPTNRACVRALFPHPSPGGPDHREADEIGQQDLEAASEVLDHLEAGRLQCGCDPSSCNHHYLGDEPGPYPRDRRGKKGT